MSLIEFIPFFLFFNVNYFQNKLFVKIVFIIHDFNVIRSKLFILIMCSEIVQNDKIHTMIQSQTLLFHRDSQYNERRHYIKKKVLYFFNKLSQKIKVKKEIIIHYQLTNKKVKQMLIILD